MRLKKPLRKLFWTTEGVKFFEDKGFFMWSPKPVEEVLKKQNRFQLVRELGDGVEEQISVNSEAIIVEVEVFQYGTFYNRGEWNPSGTYGNTPDGETICVLNFK